MRAAIQESDPACERWQRCSKTISGQVWFRFRAGPWPAWALGVPVLVILDLVVVDEMAALLPNLL